MVCFHRRRDSSGLRHELPDIVMGIIEFVVTQGVRFAEALAVAWGLVYLAERIRGLRFRTWLRSAGRAAWGPVLTGCLAAGIAAGFSSIVPPRPTVHDEFSYLLAADTFAHGRLANPSHPLWRQFETPHVIQRPTYVSKYPPGQGLVLAVGQTLLGSPMAGLWLSVGLATAAATWMLLGWLPRRWALLGGVLVALHPGIQLIWTQSYWGGNVAFTGAAMMLGACARLRRTARSRDAAVLGVGLTILAISRPFEGALASLPVAIAMLTWLRPAARTATRSSARLARVCLTLGSVMGVGAGWMAYYNWRCTGDLWKMPYMVHEETYGAAPFFLWQRLGPVPEYRDERIGRLHGWLRDTYLYQRTWAGFLREKGAALVNLWHFFLGVGLSIPLLSLPWLLRSPRYWLPAAIVAADWCALMMSTWANPHYYAPAGPAFLILVVQGLRHLSVRGRFRTRRSGAVVRSGERRPWDGQWKGADTAGAVSNPRRGARRPRFVWTVVLAQLIGFIPYARFHASQPPPEFSSQRTRLIQKLQASPGRDLVIVRYAGDYNIHQEWVHNGADIDSSEIVWARATNSASDRELAAYFADRQVWQLRVSSTSVDLLPYDTHPSENHSP